MSDLDSSEALPKTGGKKRKLLLSLGIAGVLLAGATVALITAMPGQSVDSKSQEFNGETVEVKVQDLSSISKQAGLLSHQGKETLLAGGAAGTLTDAPPVGSTVQFGEAVYWIDNVQTVLFQGGMPMWRTFESGISDGPDVQQLEETLAQLGFFWNTPDEEFTWDTADGIRLWQDHMGFEVTGSIAKGSIVFAPTPLRVSEQLAPKGTEVMPGLELIAVTSPQKIVEVELKSDDQALAKIDGPVGVTLPGGVKTTGKITHVGGATEIEKDGKQVLVIPVQITLDDPAITGTLEEVAVTVDFPSDTKEGVLAVPITGLLGHPDGGYSVEIVNADGTVTGIKVEVGVFTGGFVEVTGGELKAGDKIVVPES